MSLYLLAGDRIVTAQPRITVSIGGREEEWPLGPTLSVWIPLWVAVIELLFDGFEEISGALCTNRIAGY
jgi:hypothetical protein